MGPCQERIDSSADQEMGMYVILYIDDTFSLAGTRPNEGRMTRLQDHYQDQVSKTRLDRQQTNPDTFKAPPIVRYS